jgi:hypothetical protein
LLGAPACGQNHPATQILSRRQPRNRRLTDAVGPRNIGLRFAISKPPKGLVALMAGPFEFGNQVLISSHRKLLRSKAVVVNVAEKSGLDSGRRGRERRAQANRCRSVESGLDDVETGG